MGAVLAMQEGKEAPRLYSRGYITRSPVDEVAPQHIAVHAHLIRWGAWNASRSARRSLASAEGLYTKMGTPAATGQPVADRTVVAVERAMIGMPMLERDLLIMVYVRRFSSYTICRALRLRYESYAEHAFKARAMVQNRMRRAGFEG